MRVQIVKVGETLDGGTRVDFTTVYGAASGIWVGVAPNRSHDYYVEFDIDEELVLGMNLIEAPSHSFAISTEDCNTILQGNIESIDEDGVCTLRIGDSILLLEVTGKLPSVGSFVQVICSDIKLYDTNV